jgi:hypothetical protein
MELKAFGAMIVKELAKKYGDEAAIELQEVQKINHKVLGITAHKKNCIVSPVIYLEEYFQELMKGKDIKDILTSISSIIESVHPDSRRCYAELKDYEWIKPKLRLKVINREKNGELLCDVPHKDFLDLSVIPYIVLDQRGEMSCLIRQTMIDMWKTSFEELFGQSEDNMNHMVSPSIQKMSDFIMEMILDTSGDSGDIESDELLQMLKKESSIPTTEKEMFIISNKEKLNGAYAVFYKDLLKNLAQSLNVDGLFILPSSIHETLVVSGKGMNAADLKEMVQDINQTTVSEGEYLSNNVYYYDLNSEEIRIA